MSKKTYNSYRFTLPVATLNFLHVVKPDTKYGPPVYQLTAEFDEAEGLALVAKMEALDSRFKGLIKFTKRDGKVQLKIKQRRYITWFDKKTGKKEEKESIPVLVNADNTPYTGDEPWGGTTGEVGLTVDVSKDNNGNATTALRLKGVRFHDIKVGGGSNDDPLFGGAVAGAAAGQDEEPEVDSQDDDDNDDFFS